MNRQCARRAAAVLVLCGVVATGCGAPQPAAQKDNPAAIGDATAATEANSPLLLSRALAEAGWVQLFDGETLFGWSQVGIAQWEINDGLVQCDGTDPGFLMTTTRWADYVLKCDVRLQAGGNSGLFLRTLADPKSPATDCYELNICDSHPQFPTGSIVARTKADAMVSGERTWHSWEVRVEGTRIIAKVDGKHVVDFSDTSSAARRVGHIGLQSNGGAVAFRNVILQPLGVDSLMPANALAGWRSVPGSKSRFKQARGTIHITGGPGFLETESTWKDFVLQTDVKTNGTHLNGGIFFRAQPGTAEAPSNGYEFQIHNGYRDGDRTKPVDQGTGAIFRRAPARRVVSDDGQWCTLTLAAQGAHFATWVNGYPTVDWTDDRPADANPRKGRRLEAGHISLQGHDATTDVSFRNVRLAPLPEP